MSHIKFMIIFGKNMEVKESLMILNDHATGKIQREIIFLKRENNTQIGTFGNNNCDKAVRS